MFVVTRKEFPLCLAQGLLTPHAWPYNTLMHSVGGDRGVNVPVLVSVTAGTILGATSAVAYVIKVLKTPSIK